eukprot:559829_1
MDHRKGKISQWNTNNKLCTLGGSTEGFNFYVVISSQINHFRVVTGSEDLVCIITRDHVGPAYGIIHGCKSCYLCIRSILNSRSSDRRTMQKETPEDKGKE